MVMTLAKIQKFNHCEKWPWSEGAKFMRRADLFLFLFVLRVMWNMRKVFQTWGSNNPIAGSWNNPTVEILRPFGKIHQFHHSMGSTNPQENHAFFLKRGFSPTNPTHQEMTTAALKAQAVFRGRSVRAKLKKEKAEREEAATKTPGTRSGCVLGWELRAKAFAVTFISVRQLMTNTLSGCDCKSFSESIRYWQGVVQLCTLPITRGHDIYIMTKF